MIADQEDHGDGDQSSQATAYTERLLAETREEIGRADHKASVLLSATAVAVIVLAGLLTGNWSPLEIAAAIQWLWWIGAVMLVAAISFLGSAVMPRMRHDGDPSTVAYFGHVLRLTDRRRLVEHLHRSAAKPLDRAVDQLVVLSHIAHRKYRCVQVAIWLLAGSATFMTVSVVLNAVIK